MLRSYTDRPGPVLLGLGLALAFGAAADLVTPVFPAAVVLFVLGLAGVGAGVVLARRAPETAAPRNLIALTAPLAAVCGTLSLLQLTPGHTRGVLAANFDAPAALQDALISAPEPSPRETAELREALAASNPQPRARPASADEFLYNALLLRARDEPLRAAHALAKSLRRTADPRPDALLLYPGLLATDLPAVREALGEPPAGLAAPARAHLLALRLPPAERVRAFAELSEREPDWTLGAVEGARAILAAAGSGGPTVAAARRIAAALDRLENADTAEPLAARFLDPAGAARLAREVAEFGWVREVARRQLTVAALAPPPGMPNAPILVRVTPPEPASAVQVLRTRDAQGEVWAHVPQRTDDSNEAMRDPVPTLRISRPFRPAEMRFRYLDRDGVKSEPVTWRFDPATALRDSAQRAMQRQGPFALYQPGRVAQGRLNALPIPSGFRAGISAIEWFTDVERRPRAVPVGVTDEVVLAGEVPRTQVEFPVPPAARSLFLVAVYADGTRSAVAELPIR